MEDRGKISEVNGKIVDLVVAAAKIKVLPVGVASTPLHPPRYGTPAWTESALRWQSGLFA